MNMRSFCIRRAGLGATAPASFQVLVYAGLMLLATAPAARGQVAYVTTTGTFSNNTQTQDFFFGVGNVSNNLVLRTWAYGGGVTAAGFNVGSGGIDSTLNLFTGGGTSIALNDDNP